MGRWKETLIGLDDEPVKEPVFPKRDAIGRKKPFGDLHVSAYLSPCVFFFSLTPLPRDLVIRSRVFDLAVSCSDESYSHHFFIPLFSVSYRLSGLVISFCMRQSEKELVHLNLVAIFPIHWYPRG